MTSIGIFLALFGTISSGLTTIRGSLLRPKLVDEFPSENALLFVGRIVVTALVVLGLDLLGTIDMMSKVIASTIRANIGPGGAAGDD